MTAEVYADADIDLVVNIRPTTSAVALKCFATKAHQQGQLMSSKAHSVLPALPVG